MVQTKLKMGEYEAWVEVENQQVEHYGIDVNEETKVVTGWIASTAGKRFGICAAKSHFRFDCLADMQLDGSRISGVFLSMFGNGPESRDVAFVGEDSVRPLLFGVLNPTDDESLLGTQSYEHLGTLKVVIHRITNREYRCRPPVTELKENLKIHERAKKSLTHQVSFGDVIPAPKHSTMTYTLHEVVATFIFYYRSLDMLMAQGIVPHTPPVKIDSSEPGPVSRKRKAKFPRDEMPQAVLEISDSEDEEDNLRQEVRLEAKLNKMRNARLRRQAKKVKSEPKPVILPGEVIDLTI